MIRSKTLLNLHSKLSRSYSLRSITRSSLPYILNSSSSITSLSTSKKFITIDSKLYQSKRFFSSSSEEKEGQLSLRDYNILSDKVFDELCSSLSILVDDLMDLVDAEDIDLEYAQGVLSLRLGEKFQHKTWVLNKQGPNRQIWWSSPLSGPRRFEFYTADEIKSKLNDDSPLEFNSNYWRCTRNIKADLWNELKNELLEVTGLEMIEGVE